MFSRIKRMIENSKHSSEYIEELIEAFYMTKRLSKEEYLELKELLDNM